MGLIKVLQNAQRPLRKIYDMTGMLCKSFNRVLHVGQWEGARRAERALAWVLSVSSGSSMPKYCRHSYWHSNSIEGGRRLITTLRKLPTIMLSNAALNTHRALLFWNSWLSCSK